MIVIGIVLVDEIAAQADIAKPEQPYARRCLPIAPGPADFLVISVERRRQIGMKDKAHIRLVDAHAKSDGGADDHACFRP